MNATDYLREGYRQLSDPKFYQALNHDPTSEVATKIKIIIDKMLEKELISIKIAQFLCPPDTKPGRFYLLPKVHKKGIPGRPICSSVCHPTNKVGKFIDEHIKIYVPLVKSYIRDTQHFISKIIEFPPLPTGTLLVTMDVVSLYTNIPNHEGIVSIAHFLRQDPTKRELTPFLLKLIELVLHNTNFQFNNDNFLQIGGTSMGCPFAPSLANLFLGRFEEKALANTTNKPPVFFRYIDDCFFYWTKGRE